MRASVYRQGRCEALESETVMIRFPLWRVTIEARSRGAIGQFELVTYHLHAPTRWAAFEAAFAIARAADLETRFGTVAEKLENA